VTEVADLLEQAGHLARLEPGEPKQASLRRAISAAYYALFHFLAAQAAARLVPSEPPALAMAFRRTLDHQTMKAACERLVKGQSDPVLKSIVSYPLEAALEEMVEAFKSLQEARQTADYNMLHIWTRLEALTLVDRARRATEAWSSLGGRSNTNVFLVLLSNPLNGRRR
jgi:hypothetical protein